MSSQNDKNFFDSRTVMAVVLVGVVFFGWQKFLEYRYPEFYKQQAQAKVATGAPAASAPVATTSPAAKTELAIAETSSTNQPETKIPYEMGKTGFEISSLGMGFKNLTVSDYKDREQKAVQIGISDHHGLFEVGVLGQTEKLNFKVEKVSENVIKGVASLGAMNIEQQLTFHPETHSFDSVVTVLHPNASFKGLTLLLPERKFHQKDGTFFLPSIEHQEFVVRHQGSLDRVNASTKKEDVTKDFQQVSLVAVGSQYFASAYLDKSDTIPEVQVKAPVEGDLLAEVVYKPATLQDHMEFHWIGYAGPKSLEQLQKVDPAMGDIVNYGFFSPIGKVLLVVLKWVYSFLGNWGAAIIILTLLVRAIVLPFNVFSYKSMKKMQNIQPMLQSLRTRYKDDPAALNRETMALMKTQKVNPLGGCLPMLLQMPVFFALYQVLGQSIELYQAPFFAWIPDLSLKDPLYILPVLMGATMFVQQKITPTTMDPQQAKILQWMPVIFSVFTLSLPSGLTLYIFVSTLFGVIQQRLFMRDRKAVAQVPVAAS